MATTLNLCPAEVNLCRTRGDTQAFGFSLVDEAGAALDLTGNTYLFTVDTQSDPTDALTQVFSIAGVVSGNTVSFNLSTVEANQLGTFFFDLQETDALANIFTVAKGQIEWRQDITK